MKTVLKLALLRLVAGRASASAPAAAPPPLRSRSAIDARGAAQPGCGHPRPNPMLRIRPVGRPEFHR